MNEVAVAALAASVDEPSLFQVAYQLSLQNEAVRELNGLPAAPAPSIDGGGAEDVLDWTMFDDGKADPLSALKSGSAPKRR